MARVSFSFLVLLGFCAIGLVESHPVAATTLTPIGVSGFNRDVVVELGSSGVPYTTAESFDSPVVTHIDNSAFYEQGLTEPGSATPMPRGLPSDRTFVVPDISTTFQLQPYDQANSLRWSNGTDTLSVDAVDQRPFEQLAVLAACGGCFSNHMETVEIFFTDGTSYETTYNVYDWFGHSSNVAVQDLGRLTIHDGLESSVAGEPRLYHTLIDLPSPYNEKSLASLEFDFLHSGWANVMAVSGVALDDYVPSNASFSTASDVNVLDLDFGAVEFGAPFSQLGFDVANLVGGDATATLLFDSFTSSGDTNVLQTNFYSPSDLNGGESESFAALFVPGDPGPFDATYEFNYTDILGTEQTLTLNLSGEVMLPPDDPAIPNLIYDAATGEVILDPDASPGIIGYTLVNNSDAFLPAGHTPILGGVATSLTSEIAEAALSSASGSIGLVLPTGMDSAQLFQLLSINQVSTGLGAPLVPFDLIVIGSGAAVPEPSTYLMAAMGLLGMFVLSYRKVTR